MPKAASYGCVIAVEESRGLVRRSAHATDGRMVLLALTDAGEALMRRLFPAFNAAEAFVTTRLGTPETVQLANLLRRIVAQLEGEGEQRRLDPLAGATPQRT